MIHVSACDILAAAAKNNEFVEAAEFMRKNRNIASYSTPCFTYYPYVNKHGELVIKREKRTPAVTSVPTP